MIPSLLLTKPLPVVQNTPQYNGVNGNDAELLAGARLILACNAEISWGSRNEDGRKIDMFVSFEHPWFNRERVIFLVQVKSGPAYGSITANGFQLNRSAKLSAKRTSHEICVIWVDRSLSKLFWAYIHPNTNASDQLYSKHHSVSPALRFDIARCQAKYLPYKIGGTGLIIPKLQTTLPIRRRNALAKYRQFRLQNIICPVIGQVEFTRAGWRHMFRKGRALIQKESSLDVIMKLDVILKDIPTEHSIIKTDYFTSNHYEYRVVEHLLSYEKIRLYDSGLGDTNDIKVIVRLREEIRYPENWVKEGMLGQRVDRRVIILSCYHKSR